MTDTGRSDGISEEAWAQEHMRLWMTNEFMCGNLSIPGSELPEEPSAASRTTILEKPPLTICTWAESDAQGQPPSLVVPEPVVKAWTGHEKYGAEFQKFMSECPNLKSNISSAAAARGLKRHM